MGNDQFTDVWSILVKLDCDHQVADRANRAYTHVAAPCRPLITSFRRSSLVWRLTRLYKNTSPSKESLTLVWASLMALKRLAYCASLDSKITWLRAICIIERSR